MDWYYLKDNEQVGPHSEGELNALLQNQTLSPSDLVWKEGMQDWVAASSVLLSAGTTPSLQSGATQNPQESPFVKPQTGGNIYAAPQASLVNHANSAELVENVRVKKASFSLLMITGFGAAAVIILGYILIFAAAIMSEASGVSESVPLLGILGGIIIFLGYGLFIFSYVLSMIYLYRCWLIVHAASAGVARSTPGKAVGFLFIPFFNLYWYFQAYYGWAQDYNRYVSPRKIFVNDSYFLIFCICQLVFPYANIVLGPMVYSQMCKVINEHANA